VLRAGAGGPGSISRGPRSANEQAIDVRFGLRHALLCSGSGMAASSAYRAAEAGGARQALGDAAPG